MTGTGLGTWLLRGASSAVHQHDIERHELLL